MDASKKRVPPKSATDKEPSTGGPTAPSPSGETSREKPETGGYDDHSPDRTSDNKKGGYGAG